uniref:DNA-directed DNA polymerase n=2 Tax=Meloidogyne incognita TaxID=6306 RepID=A0A914NB71_MELIC
MEPGVAKRTECKYSRRHAKKWCAHSDEKRGFISTTCSIELELALVKGYRVTKVISIYHWGEWSDKLLRPYVQDMMRLKIEASGCPSSVLAAENPKLEQELKNEFIEKNQKEYGIQLDPSKIERNDGMRYLAKTCNNSMWGRWALRCNLTQDCITSSPVKLHTVLNDPKLEIGAVEMLTPGLFAVPFRNRREFVRPHEKYNIVLALITTANARVILYKYMDQIVNDKDCKLLYTDTDSCFYVHKRGKIPPFGVGEHYLCKPCHDYKTYNGKMRPEGNFYLTKMRITPDRKCFTCGGTKTSKWYRHSKPEQYLCNDCCKKQQRIKIY